MNTKPISPKSTKTSRFLSTVKNLACPKIRPGRGLGLRHPNLSFFDLALVHICTYYFKAVLGSVQFGLGLEALMVPILSLKL